MRTKIIVNGANGKMGRATVEAVNKEKDFELVASTGRNDDLEKIIKKTQADVVIDFTVPQSVFNNAKIILANNARPVVGTTGLTLDQIQILNKECLKKKLGGIIAPNFSLGAILMMKFARDAARYLSQVEIIEMHHAQKLDAPSGTSKKTAEIIAQARKEHNITPPSLALSHGVHHDGVPIHSVRLPGCFAHQLVIFGNYGETLTIRHDSIDRVSMMPGVILACRKVMELHELMYGLENIIGI